MAKILDLIEIIAKDLIESLHFAPYPRDDTTFCVELVSPPVLLKFSPVAGSNGFYFSTFAHQINVDCELLLWIRVQFSPSMGGIARPVLVHAVLRSECDLELGLIVVRCLEDWKCFLNSELIPCVCDVDEFMAEFD